jgi:hypothetical protein
MTDERNEVKLCGAKTKSRDGTCRKTAMENGRCRYHGGLTPKGISSPNFKHGKYSKYMPTHLSERYEELLKDSDYENLHENIALLDLRLTQLSERLNVGDYGKQWKDLREIYKTLVSALDNSDTQATQEALMVMGQTINGGDQEYQLWQQIVAVNDKRRLMFETQMRVEHRADNVLTVEQALLLASGILAIIKDEVQDNNARNRAATRIRDLMTATAPHH